MQRYLYVLLCVTSDYTEKSSDLSRLFFVEITMLKIFLFFVAITGRFFRRISLFFDKPSP